MCSTYYPCGGPAWSDSGSSSSWTGSGSSYPWGGGDEQAEPSLVTNQKQVDMEEVECRVSWAVILLGCKAADEGGVSNATTLTKGLGGDESVWKCPLAEKLALKLQEVVKSIDGNFVSEHDWVGHLLENEPEKVNKYDPRSKNGG